MWKLFSILIFVLVAVFPPNRILFAVNGSMTIFWLGQWLRCTFWWTNSEKKRHKVSAKINNFWDSNPDHLLIELLFHTWVIWKIYKNYSWIPSIKSQKNSKSIQTFQKKPIFKTFKFDVWRENVGWYISYANLMIDAYYITHKFCYLTLNSSQFSEIASRLLSVTFPQPFNLKVLSLFRFFTRLSTALSFTSLHSDRSIASREGQFSVNDLMPVSVTPLHLAK